MSTLPVSRSRVRREISFDFSINAIGKMIRVLKNSIDAD
jgi:hypothetical protein